MDFSSNKTQNSSIIITTPPGPANITSVLTLLHVLGDI